MPLNVEVVAPDADLYTGEADFVLAKSVEGELGILPGHVPVLVQLAPSTLKVRAGGEDRTWEIDGGFMTVKDDKVIILAEEVGGEDLPE